MRLSELADMVQNALHCERPNEAILDEKEVAAVVAALRELDGSDGRGYHGSHTGDTGCEFCKRKAATDAALAKIGEGK